MAKVRLLLPALLETKEQKQMAKECRESLVSKENEIELLEDNKRYPKRVAQAWNTLIDRWRGKDYDYLMIVASDTIADPNAIDYMVRCAEKNPNAGMITGKVERNLKRFKRFAGKRKYTSKLTVGLIDPACFLLRRGVIERVGRIDTEFPFEFCERDLIYRIKLAGYNVIQPDVVLWYHPPFAGTIGNDYKRLQFYLRKYVRKWNGDADMEQNRFPYNDASLDYTFIGPYK